MSEDFDLRDFALGVLEIAKENLQRDGNLIPTAFAITASHIHCYSVAFANHDEKRGVYANLIESATNKVLLPWSRAMTLCGATTLGRSMLRDTTPGSWQLREPKNASC